MTFPTIVSYYSPRPDEFGDKAFAYDEAIGIIEASCSRLGLKHVLITEKGNEDKIPHVDKARIFAIDGTQSLKLMQATVAGQMAYLRHVGTDPGGVIMTGVDCMFLKDPSPIFDGDDWDVSVTIGPYSPGGLNNGLVALAPNRGDAAARFYELALHNCPEDWMGDQESIRRIVHPLAPIGRIVDRNGFKVRFLDMDRHNLPPACIDDPAIPEAYMLHFKGARKEFMGDACEQWLGIKRPEPLFVVR
jgi:hypothetical protein